MSTNLQWEALIGYVYDHSQSQALHTWFTVLTLLEIRLESLISVNGHMLLQVHSIDRFWTSSL